MAPWQKPENALRRATELIEVGRKQDALDTLHDVIKNRKARLWTKVHEQIMHKHLELCVELRKPHLAKDGLFQYRNMCQQVNAKSLEDVILAFIQLAEKKADEARQESQGLVEDVEDLDQAESPEKLLLSVVTGEGAQDRSDRTIVSPWLRFLWESYRQCLELLRNNMQVEVLYHRVAKQAFQFCLKYQRKTEFRKLCDNLRSHLNQIQKAQQMASHFALKLTNPETLAMHQETRLTQLDIAMQMELWQEAFKSVEDVHQLMQLSKKQARTSAQASYFDKLSTIFWKADNDLYHAAVLVKLFNLTRELKKTASPEELSFLATRTLLAVLSVSSPTSPSDLSRHLEIEEVQMENRRKLATLVTLPSPPTRQTLLKDVLRSNIHLSASPVAQKLYRLLEVDFNPLSLALDVDRQLKLLSTAEKPIDVKYLEALKEVTAFKILKQVSQIYSAVKFDFLSKIIPYFDRKTIERLVVTVGKRSQIQVRIHHRTESVEFGSLEPSTDDFVSGSGPVSTLAGQPMFSLQNQIIPSEQIHGHLQQMYTALNDACAQIDAAEWQQMAGESLRNQISLYGFHKQDQHVQMLSRKRQIESYKEMNERIRSEQEEKQREQEKRSNELKMREMEKRLMMEKAERLEQQKRRDQEDLQKRIMQDRLNRMKDPKLRKIIEDLPEEELQKLDHDLILQKQISHLEREKREQMNKMKQQEKKWDYFVRAMHIEEMDLRTKEYEEWAVKDEEDWEKYEAERVEKVIQGHKLLVELVDRMKRIESDAQDVVEQVRKDRAQEFRKRLADWEQRLKDTRQKRLLERKIERKEKRREEWLQQKEAEKRRKEEEERQRKEQLERSRRQEDNRAQGRRPYVAQDGETGGERAPEGEWQRGQGQPVTGRYIQKRSQGPDMGMAPEDQTKAAMLTDWRSRPQGAPAAPAPNAQETPSAGVYRPPNVQQPKEPSRSTGDMKWRERAAPVGDLPPSMGRPEDQRRDVGDRPTPHQAYRPPQEMSRSMARQGPYDEAPPTQQRFAQSQRGPERDFAQLRRPPRDQTSQYDANNAPPPLPRDRETRDGDSLDNRDRFAYENRGSFDNRDRAAYESRASGIGRASFESRGGGAMPPASNQWRRGQTVGSGGGAAAVDQPPSGGGAPLTAWRKGVGVPKTDQ